MIAHPSGTEMIICAQSLRILTKVITLISTIFAKNGTKEEKAGVAPTHPAQMEAAKTGLPPMMES